MRRPRVLLIDPDAETGGALRGALGERGLDVADVRTLADALLALQSLLPDAVLARLGAAGEGAEVGRALRAVGSDAALVVAVPGGGLELAVEAMRAGAESYLVGSLEPAQAAVVLEKALEKRRLRREALHLREQVRQRGALVGASPELLAVSEMIRRAAPTKATVLVLGETGSGREVAAEAIHEASPRRDRPFVRVSCSSLSEPMLDSQLFGHEQGAFDGAGGRHEGALEAAHGGTLFLHEVARLPPGLQIKLLRVLQAGELERMGGAETLRVDVRVVASSTRDLAEEVRAGRFRDDLYYRLNVVALQLPPLRRRKGDIPALAEHFLRRAGDARGAAPRALSPGALSALFAYDWPGNVRELEATLQGALDRCAGGELLAEHLPPVLHAAEHVRSGSALIPGATLFEIEREAILRTLEEVGGSTVRAAEVLGVSVRKIQYRLKEYRTGEAARRRRDAA